MCFVSAGITAQEKLLNVHRAWKAEPNEVRDKYNAAAKRQAPPPAIADLTVSEKASMFKDIWKKSEQQVAYL